MIDFIHLTVNKLNNYKYSTNIKVKIIINKAYFDFACCNYSKCREKSALHFIAPFIEHNTNNSTCSDI